jgi:hypothetical protein
VSTVRIDGATYKTRRVETGSEMWGGFDALEIDGTWRFIVRIRGVRCVVMLSKRAGAVELFAATDARSIDRVDNMLIGEASRRGKTEGQVVYELLERANHQLSDAAWSEAFCRP